MIVALRSLPIEYNTIKGVIRGRENLISLKELRSQLKAEETTLQEATKQIPLMATMYTHGTSSTYEHGGSSGSQLVMPFATCYGNTSGFSMSFSPVPQLLPQGFQE